MKIPRDNTPATPPGGIYRSVLAIAVLFLLLGGVAPATAQPIRMFQLEGINGTVEAGFLANLQDRKRDVSSSSEFDRVELSQLLHLNAYGYIYHPRFLTFDTGFQFEAIEGLAGQSDNRLLGGGDFRFNFLQSHPNSLTVFGSAVKSESTRPFSETYETISKSFGATFFQKWGWIPFDLTYLHGERKGGTNSQLDDSWDKVTFDGSYQIGEESDGRLVYDLAFEDIRDQDIRRQSLLATNLSHLGEVGNKTLQTDVRLFDESNGQHLRNARGDTVFDWMHADNLRTQYSLSVLWDDSDFQTATILDSHFSLTHQLYESLGTDFEIFARFEDASFRTRDEFGSRISENYLKQLGDWGHLNLRVTPHVSIASNRLDEDTAFVFDEGRILVGLLPTFLQQPDIIESSIVVTDKNGSIVYGEGPLGDYIVVQNGGSLEIGLQRTPLSNIADGELVLVNYEFEVVGDNDTLTTGVGTYASLSFFDRWKVFGHYDTIDFHVLSGDEEDLRFNSFDRYVAGVGYDAQWLSAKATFEENDAELTPSRRYSGSVSIFTYGTESWSGRLGADYDYVDLGNSAQTVRRFSLAGNVTKHFFKWGLLEIDGGWMRERWSGQSAYANDIDALRLKLNHSWWYGKVEFKLETGFAQLLRPVEDLTVFRFDLRVRRVF